MIDLIRDIQWKDIIEETDNGGEQAYRYTDGPDYIYLEKWPIIRRTEKGFWVKKWWEINERFVLNNDKPGRRWAYEKKADALESYKRRKEWQIRHAEIAIAKAKQMLALVEKIKNDPNSSAPTSD